MKTQIINRFFFFILLMTNWIAAHSQNQLEVPGDNFSLEGALELFKKSNSPEQFERMLNNPESRVNNLDLNGDRYIDYIKVFDLMEGNVHVFVIQAVISDRENQDIAVITLEKLANGKAVLQIIGDEDIYGIETIIEPTREVYTYGGTTPSQVYVNVWSWPMVQYVYGPHYTVWFSPWGWNYRPHWWVSYRPVLYYDYYTYWSPYQNYYSHCHTHRIVYVNNIYRPHRTTSVIVQKRHSDRVTYYRNTHLGSDGRYQSSNKNTGRRPSNNAVRYNANGRISSTDQVSSRPSSDSRVQQRPSGNTSRPTTTQSNRSTYRESSANSNRYSTQSNPQKSSLNANVQRPTSNSNARQSTGTSTNQNSSARSYGDTNVNRSSGSSNVQRSSSGYSSDSNVQRSSGNSNASRSSGSSNVQKSPSSASRSTNVQRSSGSSSSSSGNVQHSSSRSSNIGNTKQSSTNSSSRSPSNNSRTSR